MVKRIFDIVLGAVALVFLAIPMLLIALAIRLGSRGGAVFRQQRAGWQGKPFMMLKFRTMRADVDPYGHSPHSPGDPRLTRLGRFLRQSSLDELPQLLNVLKGEMSLVGPRPLYERQAALWNDCQRRRLEVRPGMTGYAQVCGRGGMTHEQKLEMDVFYVENRSFRLDLKIIFLTVVSFFRKKDDIYEKRYSRDQETEIGPSDEQV